METPKKSSGDKDNGDGEQQQAASAAATTTTIWGTRESLAEHPLLQTAIDIVLENIQNCLSHSYDIVDSKGAPDHKSVMLSLPGTFTLGALSGIAGRTTRAPNFGIQFSEAIVGHSTKYSRRVLQEKPNAVDFLEDFNVLQFIAVLQQTLELELGHLKFHAEGVKDENGGNDDKMIKIDTPQRLRFEAGYAVQMNIRMNHFKEEVDDGEVVLVDLESEPGEEPVRTARSFLYPDTIPKNVKDGENQLDSDDSPTPLQKDELVALMDYPRTAGCFSSKKRKRGEEDEDFTGGGPDDEPFDDSGGSGGDRSDRGPGGGGNTSRGSGRKPRSWEDSIRHFLPSAIAKAQLVWQDTTTFSPEKLDAMGSKKLKRHGRVTKERIAAFRRCEFEVQFCDSSKRIRSCFAHDEDVCVMVTVTNTTGAPVVVYMTAGKYFGRSGCMVEIENVHRGRVGNSYVHRMHLSPGEDFTAFRTIAKPLEPDGIRHSEVAYVTPPVGEYSAFVSIFGEHVGASIPFSIVSRQEETGTILSRASASTVALEEFSGKFRPQLTVESPA